MRAVTACSVECPEYSSMQANQAHPRPQTPDPALTQMYWTQLNKAILVQQAPSLQSPGQGHFIRIFQISPHGQAKRNAGDFGKWF